MNHAPDLLHGDEVLDARLVGQCVNADFGDVHGPRVSAVGVAAVVLVVPLDVLGLLVLRQRLERAVLLRVLAHARAHSSRVNESSSSPAPTSFSFNWSAADSTSFPTIIVVREATVGPLFGTLPVSGARDFDRVVVEPERVCDYLREDGVCPLPYLCARGEDVDASLSVGLAADD